MRTKLFSGRGHRFRENLNFPTRTRLLCWVWALVVIVFFAFSTNQEYYTFPAYIPLLILLADALDRGERAAHPSRWMLGGNVAYASLGILAGMALIWALWASRHVPLVSDIGSVLVERDVAHNTLSMSHVFDLTTKAFAALRLPAVLVIAALLIGSPLVLVLCFRQKYTGATWAMAGSAALLLVAAQIAFGRFGPYLSSKNLAQKLERLAKPGDKIMIHRDQAYGSSLLFYLRKRIYLVNGRTTSMWLGSQYPDAPPIFLSDADLARAWTSAQRVFVFVPPDQRAHAERMIPHPRYIVAESSGKVIYSNISMNSAPGDSGIRRPATSPKHLLQTKSATTD